MQIQGQAALVTGGASGLGEATARALAAQGAKVAVLDRNAELAEKVAADIGGVACPCDITDAASVQAAIVDVLVKKSLMALKDTGLKRLVVAGGVGANKSLREQLNAACAKRKVRVHYPELHLCTDNGAMIAMAAAMRLQAGMQEASRAYTFEVKPRWPLDAISQSV